MKNEDEVVSFRGQLEVWLSVMDAQVKMAEKNGWIKTEDDWFYRHVKGESN